jgi:hypothetical protein
MRRVWMLLAVGVVGCASGRPAGAFRTAQALRYRPLTPAAAPRAVPAEVQAPAPSRPAPALRGSREQVLAVARSLVGRRTLAVDGRRFAATCNGLVEAAYHGTGLSLEEVARPGDNAVTALYRLALARGRLYREGPPRPGDLVFFRDTYDINRDGRSNDGLTHVALVESVDAQGTVTLLHHVQRGVVRTRMTPGRPSLRKDPRTGRVLNHALRAGGQGRAAALTGELFATYGSLLPEGKAEVARR